MEADPEPRVGHRAADRADDAVAAARDVRAGRQTGLQVRELAAHRARRVHEEVDVGGADLDVDRRGVDDGCAAVRERVIEEGAAVAAAIGGRESARAVALIGYVGNAVTIGVGEGRRGRRAADGADAAAHRIVLGHRRVARREVGRVGHVAVREAAGITRVADRGSREERRRRVVDRELSEALAVAPRAASAVAPTDVAEDVSTGADDGRRVAVAWRLAAARAALAFTLTRRSAIGGRNARVLTIERISARRRRGGLTGEHQNRTEGEEAALHLRLHEGDTKTGAAMQ